MEKKRVMIMISFVFLVFLGVNLIGCSSKGTPAVTPEKPNVESNPIKIVHKVYQKNIVDDDGTVLVKARITTPEIKDHVNHSSINEFYGIEFDHFISTVLSEGLDKAIEDRASAMTNGYDFHPHDYDRNFSVSYNGNDLLSVLCLQYENSGGAHPNSFWSSQTFNMKTGERLSLTDIMNGSEEEVLEKVFETVITQIEESKGTDDFFFYEGYKDDVRNYSSLDDFVLTNDSIIFYFQPYVIAPYAAGIPTFVIPLDQSGTFREDIPILPENALENELYDNVMWLIDNNRIAFSEIFLLSMLQMKMPEAGMGEEMIFPVTDERFATFADLERFVRNTYVKSEADSLLGSGKYIEKDGRLYGDVSKDGGMGYYVNWNDYSYEISDIEDNSATLNIYTEEESPAGREELSFTVTMLKENGSWLLQNMVY